MKKHATIFFANGLGDCILTLPTLRALSQHLPFTVSLVTDASPTELLFGDVGFSDTSKFEMSRLGPGQPRDFDATEVAKQVSGSDIFISLVPWSSESLRRLIESSIFEATFGFGPGFDFCLQPNADKHAADRSFDMVKKFRSDLELLDFAFPVKLPEELSKASAQIRRAIGEDRRILVVHEETSTPEKCWDPIRMKDLLRKITDRYLDMTVLVISRRGPSFDVSGLEDRIVTINKTSFGLFLAVIADADVFLGVDSVGLHAADLWGVPSVGLFGPTRPAEWGFRFSTSFKHVDGEGSMENISVDVVLGAVDSVLRDILGEHQT